MILFQISMIGVIICRIRKSFLVFIKNSNVVIIVIDWVHQAKIWFMNPLYGLFPYLILGKVGDVSLTGNKSFVSYM